MDTMTIAYQIESLQEILKHIRDKQEKIILTPRNDDVQLIQEIIRSLQEIQHIDTTRTNNTT